MKRDLSLVRILLERIENRQFEERVDVNVEGYSKIEVMYHLKLLLEVGYIEADDFSSKEGLDYEPLFLTWQGHEFLDAIRNETALNKVRSKAGGDLSNVPFEVLKNVLGETIKYGFQSLWQ